MHRSAPIPLEQIFGAAVTRYERMKRVVTAVTLYERIVTERFSSSISSELRTRRNAENPLEQILGATGTHFERVLTRGNRYERVVTRRIFSSSSS